MPLVCGLALLVLILYCVHSCLSGFAFVRVFGSGLCGLGLI